MTPDTHYPVLPEAVDELAMEDGFNVIGVQPVYTADQMRAYVDADRAARSPASMGGVSVSEAVRLLRIFQNNLGSHRGSCDETGKVVWDQIDAALIALAQPQQPDAAEKSRSLDRQIADAQAEVASWPPERLAACRLQGAVPDSAPTPPSQAAVSQDAVVAAQLLLRHKCRGATTNSVRVLAEAVLAAAAAQPAPVSRDVPANSGGEDAELLDHLDGCCEPVVEGQTMTDPYGEHVANRWSIEGPFASVRDALRAARKGQGGGGHE